MRPRQSYRFGYRWTIRGPIDTVFHYVSDARTFDEWFDVFKEVRPEHPTRPVDIGSRTHCRVKALLPYQLDWDITVSQIEPPRLLQTDVHLVLSGKDRGELRIQFYSSEDLGRLLELITNSTDEAM